MIVINKNTINEVFLTLNEKVTISNPYFLFIFTHDLIGVSDYDKAFICEDTTGGAIERYNRFLIEETAAEDLLDGKVRLSRDGFWYYRVYAQASSTNLDPSLAAELVEQGKVDVYGNEDLNRSEYNPTITSNSYNANE